jgi:hypothetical protein
MAGWPVYSTRFIAVATATGSYTYTVPAGYVAIVKCADVVTTTTSSSGFILQINNVTAIWYMDGSEWSAQVHSQWTGHQVVNPGEVLDVYLPSSAYFCCSGYLLSLP